MGNEASITVYNWDRRIAGTVVRDDQAEPHQMIIRLDDGRYVRSCECQYTFGCTGPGPVPWWRRWLPRACVVGRSVSDFACATTTQGVR